MNSDINKTFSRRVEDFLVPAIGEKAGIIEARLGSSAPCKYNASFAWPARPSPPAAKGGVTGIEYDSRKVTAGSLYFALPGLHADGHDFIDDATGRGAAVVVHERELAAYRDGVLYIRVKDSRFAMSPVSAAFYDYPSRKMAVAGVTGTEGKSTTVYLIYQLLKLAGKKAGFISTVMQGDGIDEMWTKEHQTTPEAPVIHRLLAEMFRNGAEFAVLESSSHGLSARTNRLGDVDFDAGVTTNVTHEHLEFHGTWEQYRSDKAELFRALDVSAHRKQGAAGEFSVPAFGVVNADDPSAEFFFAATKHRTLSFSTKGAKADISLTRIKSRADGNAYDVFIAATGKTITVNDNLPGAFNAGNVLAALLVVSNLLSVDIDALAPLVPRLKPVRGRMTSIRRGQPFEVLIDYAHTPSSFETIFPPLRARMDSSGGRIICLFGSAGERDTQKRRLQGEIAGRYSDIVILADEDPRGEDPMTILEEIAKGCETASGCETTSGSERARGRQTMIRDETLFLIPDRPAAIRKAVALARQGDLILLLGKGHENSIIYARGKIEYDEIQEAETALKEAGYFAAAGHIRVVQ